MIDNIMENKDHPLNNKIAKCHYNTDGPKTRRRTSIIYCRTEKYKCSFIPSAAMYLAGMYSPILL